MGLIPVNVYIYIYIYIYTYTVIFTFRAFSRCFYPKRLAKKYICQKKENRYISVGTVRMFIEPSAKN